MGTKAKVSIFQGKLGDGTPVAIVAPVSPIVGGKKRPEPMMTVQYGQRRRQYPVAKMDKLINMARMNKRQFLSILLAD